MIPIRDINPRHKFPIVTVILIAINVLVFVLIELPLFATVDPNTGTSVQLASFFDQYAVIPEQLLTNFFPEIPSVFTSMFLHGGFGHLGGNMLYLWIFGDNIEDELGHFRYLIFYLLCGVIATVVQVAFNALTGGAMDVPNIGASGAIAGVLGGYLMMFPRVQVMTVIPILLFMRIPRIPALGVLGFWFVMQLFNGLQNVGAQGGGVAFFAHVGGFVAGFLLVRAFAGEATARSHDYWETLTQA